MQQTSIVSLRKLLTVSIHLATEACNILHNYAVNKNAKKYMKDIDDPVTQADFKIQSLLIKGIKKEFPQLKIVGEQQKQFDGTLEYDYSIINNELIPEDIKINRQVPDQQLCVWIDPIDCTKGFVKEQFQDCTILIGISQKKYAQLGIVGIPYKLVDGKSVFNPSVLIGSATQKLAYQYFPYEKKWQKLQKAPLEQKITVTTSINRESPKENFLIQQLGASQIKVGGSGRKIAMVVKQNVSLAAYTMTGTSKWDSCAGQAVVKALEGNFTDCSGSNLQYDFLKPKQKNMNGFLCTMDSQLHNKAVEMCKKFDDVKPSF